MKWSDDALHDLLAGYQYSSRREIKTADYEAIVSKLKLGPSAKTASA